MTRVIDVDGVVVVTTVIPRMIVARVNALQAQAVLNQIRPVATSANGISGPLTENRCRWTIGQRSRTTAA